MPTEVCSGMIGAVAGDIIGFHLRGRVGLRDVPDLLRSASGVTEHGVASFAVAAAIMDDLDLSVALRAFARRHPRRSVIGNCLDWSLGNGVGAYGQWCGGAPFRVAAAGWLAADKTEARAVAQRLAAISLGGPACAEATAAVAVAVLAARSDEHPACGSEAENPGPAGRSEDAQGDRTTVVDAALMAAFAADSWEAAVQSAVGFPGDARGFACIAGAVAEARLGIPSKVEAAVHLHLAGAPDLREVLSRFQARREKMRARRA